MTDLNNTVMQRAAVIAILLVGTALRLIGIGTTPPGLYNDEAQHGLDAAAVLDGNPQFYFAENNGREPLYIYLVTASQAILGPSPLAVRLPAAFVGILTIAATYTMAKSFWHHRAGTYAAAILAGTFWHVHLSRMGYRAVLLPLFTALMFAFIARALRTKRNRWWITAGIAYALGWYSYMAARFTPVAILLILIAIAIWYREQAKPHVKGFVVFCITALVVLMPLGIYTLLNPDIVLARTGQVSIFSEEISGGEPVQTLVTNIGRALGLFFIKGDRIWRHNLAWRPMWGPMIGLLCLIGFTTLLIRFTRDKTAAVILLWTLVMLLPTVLAEDCPHFLRGVGILPVAVLIPTTGLLVVEHKMAMAPQHFQRTLPWLVWLVLVVAAGKTARDYHSYSNMDMTGYWLEDGVVQLAGEINSITGSGWDGKQYVHDPYAPGTVYVEEQLWSKWKALRYLNTTGIEVGTPVQTVGAAQPHAVVVWPYQDWHDSVLPYLPHPALIEVKIGPDIQGDLDPEPFSMATVIKTEPIPDLPQSIAAYTNGMKLYAALVHHTSRGSEVLLWWEAIQPLEASYIVFIHAMDGETRVDQNDSVPALGHLPTNTWQPGDVILDRHLLTGTYLNSEMILRIGMYNPAGGEDVSVLDHAGNPASPWLDWPVIETEYD